MWCARTGEAASKTAMSERAVRVRMRMVIKRDGARRQGKSAAACAMAPPGPMSDFGIDVERDAIGGAWVVLRNRTRLNAVRLEMWQALPGIVGALAADPSVRVLVLRGAGEEAFASGADISEFATRRGDAASAAAYEGVTGEAFAALLAV